jgi:hypothetical protein
MSRIWAMEELVVLGIRFNSGASLCEGAAAVILYDIDDAAY